ncbi:hypothetical protein [Amycolatopsis sp. lyj-112]|uniref:hypothetical protein n=1 Tax=Amycolatopsis sp. lyj-112 TaxID=2789288 RepID=UPI003978A85F
MGLAPGLTEREARDSPESRIGDWLEQRDDLDTFIAFADSVHLDGVVEKITVPFLIAHGEKDRQIPLDYAHRSYDQAGRPSTSDSTTFPT